MDLILQRAGRLHRHHIARPKELQMPQLFVMGISGPGEYGDANEAVYQKYLLMKTDHFLGKTIAIPGDISVLVQKVYDQGNDAEITADEMPELDKEREVFNDNLKKERDKAQAFQVGAPRYRKHTIHGWLDRTKPNIDTDEQRANATVRDIKETLEVILLQHTSEGDF